MLTDPCAVTQKLSTGSSWQLASLEPEHDGNNGSDDNEWQPEVTGDPFRVPLFGRQRREDRLHPEVVTAMQEDRRPHAVGFQP
jgi:hypothetical protein